MAENNADNLIPVTLRTKDEAREISKIGGIASGEARREKGRIRRALELALERLYEVDGEKVTGTEGIAAKMIRKALDGDVQAFKEIRDTVGEKPKDEVGHSFDSEPTRISITFADKSKRKNYVEKDPVIIDGAALKDDRES